jgi:hypothetical protein
MTVYCILYTLTPVLNSVHGQILLPKLNCHTLSQLVTQKKLFLTL